MYKKILKKTFGILLIIVGIIGLFLPIIQGVLLILAGLALMGIKIDDIKAWLKKKKRALKNSIY